MSRAVMQQALDALEWGSGTYDRRNAAIAALHQALAEPDQEPQTTHWEGCEAVHPECRKPEQEPVAWMDIDDKGQRHGLRYYSDGSSDEVPLYTASTPRKPLTDEEIDRVTDQQWAQNNHKPIYAAHRAYARAIERAHGIGEQHE